MTRIFIEDTELDLSKDFSHQLTFSIDDINKLDSKTTSFSKTIVIPGTANNNRIFGNIFELANSNFNPDAYSDNPPANILYNFNASRSAKARIEINGLKAMKGVLRLLSITVDKGNIEYEVALFGELGGFISAIGNKKLEDIDFSYLNHDYTGENIVKTWEDNFTYGLTGGLSLAPYKITFLGKFPITLNPGDLITLVGSNQDGPYKVTNVTLTYVFGIPVTNIYHETNSTNYTVTGAWTITKQGGRRGYGYVYPLINYGNVSYNYPAAGTPSLKRYRDWSYLAFRPAIYVLEYMDKIIKDSGYQYESEFFKTDYFRSLIIPNNDQIFQRQDTVKYVDNYKGSKTINYNDNLLTKYEIPYPTAGSLAFFSHPANNIFRYTNSNIRKVKIIVNVAGTLTKDSKTVPSINLYIKKANNQYIKLGSYAFEVKKIENLEFNGKIEVETDVDTNDELFVEAQIFTYPEYDATSHQWNDPNRNVDLVITYTDFNVLPTPQGNVPYLLDDTIDMKDVIPKNILQRDFFTSIMKMFNLMVVEDKDREKFLKIEPYIYFYQTARSSYIDWTYKINRAKPIQIKPMSEVTARYYKMMFATDSDYYNDLYNKTYSETYGNRIYDNRLEFAKDNQEVKVIFSPSVLTGYQNEDKIFANICKINNDVEEAMASNIRIMFVKRIEGVNNWTMFDPGTGSPSAIPINGTTVRTSYMYAGHFDDPDAPSLDLNFGATKQLYYNLTTGALQNNVFNLFYSSYMAEITDKDSRLVTAEVKLSEIDIYNLDFSRFILVDGVLFRLIKINDWSEGELCKVDLLRVINTTYLNLKLNLLQCTINPDVNGEINVNPYGVAPYFYLWREFYAEYFPYVFELNSFIINGIQYASGQELSINDLGDITIAVSIIDGCTYYTNVTDWINGIIPTDIDLQFLDDFNTVQYANNITFDLQINTYGTGYGSGSGTYRYTNDGISMWNGTEWVSINASDGSYKNCKYVTV